MDIRLDFKLKEKVVLIDQEGEIEFLPLYLSINNWLASRVGMAWDHIIEGSGNVELPDGTKTPRTMIFINEWKLGSNYEVSITGGYITGRDKNNKYRDPIQSESHFRITLLSNPEEESLFIPTEAQKSYAIEQGKLFGRNWEVVTTPNPKIRRKENAESIKDSVFALYWFLRLEWLRNHSIRKFTFPVKGDNQIPREGIVRHYSLTEPWSIDEEDLKFLIQGPLIYKDKVIVNATKTIDTKTDDIEYEVAPKANFWNLMWENLSVWKKWRRKPQGATEMKKRVTVGLITALPEEYAVMSEQIEEKIQYVGKHGRLNFAVTLGAIPAYGGGTHTVALGLCEMGNNSSAIKAGQLLGEFPNIQELIMVGIAGGCPNPSDRETHVRLGDIVVSGPDGVIQYDMIKEKDGEIEHRHQPRPPSHQMLQSVRHLQAEELKGNRLWIEALTRTNKISGTRRPSIEDVLMSNEPPHTKIDHPDDPHRIDGIPMVIVGAIGAANKLLKNADERDKLRDNYKIRAVEMEGSGLSDAARAAGSEYLVIRGACDYCDKFKNDAWHLYAASVASAYCRAVLEYTPRYDIIVR